jgi:tetratricopeptide (TPR) repeat protein
MLETDDSLDTLIQKQDHVNVLRYLRIHQLRRPDLVISTVQAWLGRDLSGAGGGSSLRWSALGGVPVVARMAALEQLCLASLDVGDLDLAALAIDRLQELGVQEGSTRLKLLQGRILEAREDYPGAERHYQGLLEENPANLFAMKRLYCIHKAQVGGTGKAVEALNEYLQRNCADTPAWHEMAALRMELGDYAGAAYALEEVLMMAPAEPAVHVLLGECLVTSAEGNKSSKAPEILQRARRHMAQALELDPTNRRAQLGLVCASNAFLAAIAAPIGKASDSNDVGADDHDKEVAQELVKYGAEQVLQSYHGSLMYPRMQKLMAEYTAGL